MQAVVQAGGQYAVDVQQRLGWQEESEKEIQGRRTGPGFRRFRWM